VTWTLAVDAVTAEVAGALGRAGVPSILLKGPTIARWLYGGDRARHYTDSDLLVDTRRLGDAQAVLRGLGFTPAWGPLEHAGMEAPPSAPWSRGPFAVDLHDTLPGATAPREHVWDVLSADTVELALGDGTVDALGESARLAHVVLHAAHHGARVDQPLRDLAAALEQIPDERWLAAAEVASQLGAAAPFANGLTLLPEARGLARRLGIEARPSTAWLLQAAGGVPVAAGLERLRTAGSTSAQMRILVDELFPSPEFMRWWTPLARRSRGGLVAAYVSRAAYLALHAPAGVRAWRRASKESSQYRRSS
jgi:hypothetical protein